MTEYVIGVPEVHINWVKVEAENLDSALYIASEGDKTELEDIEEVVYDRTLDLDEFKIRLPNGDEVTSEEALDLEGTGEPVGHAAG